MKSNRAPLQDRRSASLIRLGAVLGLVAGGLLFSGCSTLSARRDFDTIVAMAPAPVVVAKGQELRTADAAAAHLAGAQSFIGAGDSMQPIYASGTALVVTPCDFAQLRPGLSVVYVNGNGQGVAHALIRQTRDGWVAQGVNNAEPDQDLVTARNLVGVITQAYASSDTSFRREVAARSASNLGGANAQVALNLSKAGSTNTELALQ